MDGIEDVMVTFRRQLYVMRLVNPEPQILLLVILDRDRVNLVTVRREIRTFCASFAPGKQYPPDPPAQELPRRAGPVHVPGPRTAEGQPGAGPAQSQAHRERPAGLKALAGGPPSPAPAVTLTVPLTSGWRNRPGCIRAR